jgi:hypothetical protein
MITIKNVQKEKQNLKRTLKQKPPEGVEQVSQIEICGKTVQAEATASANTEKVACLTCPTRRSRWLQRKEGGRGQ